MRRKLLCCAFATLLITESGMAQVQQSMTVDELFEYVESGSKALNTQKTGIDVAKRAIEEAKSQRLPDINVSLSASYNGNVLMTDRDFGNAKGITQPHFGNSFAVEAQQVVYAGGAINSGIRLAELQKAQNENSVSLTRNQTRFIALGQYLELYKLDNGIKVYNSNIKLTEKLIADIKARQAQGMALKNDITRYELQMESLKLGKRKLEDQKSILNHQLCNTLGLSNTIVIPNINLNGINKEKLSENELQASATANSPILQQSSLGIKMAEQQLKLAKSELMPKIGIFASDSFAGPFTYDIPPIDKNFNIWFVGIGVKYSISSLFKGNKTVRKAKEQLRMSNDSHLVASENVNNSMQQAYTMHQQAFTELHTQQKSVELAKQNYEVVNNRYLNQLALITDMIDASNIKLNAELQEVNAQINIAYTYYNIQYVAGTLNR